MHMTNTSWRLHTGSGMVSHDYEGAGADSTAGLPSGFKILQDSSLKHSVYMTDSCIVSHACLTSLDT